MNLLIIFGCLMHHVNTVRSYLCATEQKVGLLKLFWRRAAEKLNVPLGFVAIIVASINIY
jgi:hypothetical protein